MKKDLTDWWALFLFLAGVAFLAWHCYGMSKEQWRDALLTALAVLALVGACYIASLFDD